MQRLHRLFLLLIIIFSLSSHCDDPLKPDNTPPVITSLIADPPSVDLAGYAYITCIATDAEGDSLSYTWSVTGEGRIVWGTGSTVNYEAPQAEGPNTITCSVSDGHGGTASESLSMDIPISFGPQQVITTQANGARSVYATDLDGDGDQDVLSASSTGNNIAWYENDGLKRSS